MSGDNIPTHVALIPDGNRRWAAEHNLPSFEGHRRGYEVSQMVVHKAWDLGVQIMSLWGFSTENWSRSEPEVTALMSLFAEMMDTNLKEALEKNTRIIHLGRKDRLSKELREKIIQVEERTAQFSEHYLVIGLDYGGKDEIVRAIREVLQSGLPHDTITIPIIEQYLDTRNLPQSAPDLIIRTGGEKRTSGFMTWQTDYSEWSFVDKYLPDFTIADFEQCIADYQHRKRRFGG